MSWRTWFQVALGVILGAALMTVYQGREMDHMNQEFIDLQQKYEYLQQKNTQLQTRLQQTHPSSPSIQGFRVQAKAPDALSELEGIQFVKQQLSFLIGRPLLILQEHPDLPFRLLDGRTFSVGQEKYTVRLTTVVVDQIPYLRITASVSG